MVGPWESVVDSFLALDPVHQDIPFFQTQHRLFRHHAVQRQSDRADLVPVVLDNDGTRVIHPRRSPGHTRPDGFRRAVQIQAEKAHGVQTNVHQRPTTQVQGIEAALWIKGFLNAIRHLDHFQPTQLPGFHHFPDFSIERHMKQCGSVHEHEALLFRQIQTVAELPVIETQRLFAEYMFSCLQRSHGFLFMDFVGGADVENVRSAVCQHGLQRGIDGSDSVLVRCLFRTLLVDGKNAGDFMSRVLQRLRHLCADPAGSRDRPFVLLHCVLLCV